MNEENVHNMRMATITSYTGTLSLQGEITISFHIDFESYL